MRLFSGLWEPTFLGERVAGRSSVGVGDQAGVNAHVLLLRAVENHFGPVWGSVREGGGGHKTRSDDEERRVWAEGWSAAEASLVSLGLGAHAAGVRDVLVVLGPDELGVGRHVAALEVQRDDAVVVHVHHDLRGAWTTSGRSTKGLFFDDDDDDWLLLLASSHPVWSQL